MSELTQATRPGHVGRHERRGETSTLQWTLSGQERLARLLEEGSFSEDGPGAGGVITGTGTIAGRPVAVMADDPIVMAGRWGSKEVEKIVRIQERALSARVPIIYLLDSPDAGVGDDAPARAGRRGVGRILHTEVKLSGSVPQVCVLSRPGAGEAAAMPALCDIAIARDGDASTGPAARHLPAASDEEAIDLVKRYLSYFPSHWEWAAPVARPAGPASERSLSAIVPEDGHTAFDVRELLESLLDAASFFELHARWAPELVAGLGRLNGRAIGVVVSQPSVKAGSLCVDSADKSARFVQTCNAFNLPLLFLVDAPGFMIAPAAAPPGIGGRDAKMISAVSQATVPKISVMVRKARGAGLWVAGPGMEADACLALPTAAIAADVDGLDAVVQPEDLRAELIRRFAAYAGKRREWPAKRNAITPIT